MNFSRRIDRCAIAVLLLFIGSMPAAWPAPVIATPSASDVASAISSARARALSVSFDFETDRYHFDGGLSDDADAVSSFTLPAQPTVRYSGRYQAGSRTAEQTYQTIYFESGKEIKGAQLTQSWDGTRLWHASIPPEGDLDCPLFTVTEDPNGQYALEAEPIGGHFMDGRIAIGDFRDELEFLGGSKASQIHAGAVGGVLRLYVDSSPVRGWIAFDPAQIDRLSRFDLTLRYKKPSGLRGILEKIRPALRVEWYRVHASDIQFEEFNGIGVPVAGRLLVSQVFSDGSAQSELYLVRRSHVQVNADATTSRSLLERPEGSIWNLGANWVPYVWRRGELQSEFDPASIRSIDRAIAELGGAKTRASAMREFPPPPAAPAADAEPDRPTTAVPCVPNEGAMAPYYELQLLARLRGATTSPTQFLEQAGRASEKATNSLVRSARAAGLFARPFTNLSLQGLVHAAYPMLLSVRAEVFDKSYQGWELFLGAEQGSVLLFSPQLGLHREPLDRLMAEWNGGGIAVATSPIGFLALHRAEVLRLGAVTLAFLLVAGVAWRIARGKGSARPDLRTGAFLRHGAFEFGGFCGVAVLLGLLWNAFSPQGLLKLSGASSAIRVAHAGMLAGSVERAEVAARSSKPDGVALVDAREPESFRSGHIPGAINVPVAASDEIFRKATEGVSKEKPLIVYCSSASCHMADYLAARLSAAGYENLRIYRGGWADWAQAGASSPSNPGKAE